MESIAIMVVIANGEKDIKKTPALEEKEAKDDVVEALSLYFEWINLFGLISLSKSPAYIWSSYT